MVNYNQKQTNINSANGILCFGPSFFVSCAFILSMYAQWRCNYVSIEGGEGSIMENDNQLLINGFGPTCYQVRCMYYQINNSYL